MKRGLPCLLLLASCRGAQSSFDAGGEQARLTNNLFGVFIAVAAFFFLCVLVLLAIALLRRRSVSPARRERWLVAWGALIIVGLTGLTLASFFTDRGLAHAGSAPSPLHIRVTAQQWWWQVEYLDPAPSGRFKTANELHLPVGRPVRIELASSDVIHSLWLPGLAGKQDLIPGRVSDLEITPQATGVFRGQCAEFCGLEHARMALEAIVETPADFEAWRRRSLAPALTPTTEATQAGYTYFINGPCSACHTISGTPAQGSLGPDLSHFASRPTIAAGMFPNTHGHVEGWIANPQALKPGSRMPTIDIAPGDLHAVAAYLESLH